MRGSNPICCSRWISHWRRLLEMIAPRPAPTRPRAKRCGPLHSPCGAAEKRRSPRRARTRALQHLTSGRLFERSVAKRVRRGLGFRASQGTRSEAEGGVAGAPSLPTFLGAQESRSPAGAKSRRDLAVKQALDYRTGPAGSSPPQATPFLCVDKERKQRKRPWCPRPPLRYGAPAMLAPCDRAELAPLRWAQTGGPSQMLKRASTRASQAAVLLGVGTRELQDGAGAPCALRAFEGHRSCSR